MSRGATAARAPLILVSGGPGRGPDDGGPRPRTDVELLAARLGAPVLPPPARRAVARVESRLGMSPGQGVAAARRRAGAFVSLSEGAALPVVLADRARRPHVAVVHNVTRPRMRLAQRATRFLRRLDRVVVLCGEQGSYLRDEAGVAAERVRVVPDKVDHRFWSPAGAACDGSVVAVGAEGRDYETLAAALAPVPVAATVVASSLWAGPAGTAAAATAAGLRVRGGLPFAELRALYDRAAVVVVPLRAGLRYAAGVNAVLEAMAMGKALVVTATPGLADYVTDGVDAVVVPPADPVRLRAAVAALLEDAPRRAALGARARAVVDGGRNLDRYVDALAGVLSEAVEEAR